MTNEQDIALNFREQTYDWETDDLPSLRLLISRPLNLRQRRIQIINKMLALFHKL